MTGFVEMLQRLSGDVAERGIRTLVGLLTHTPLAGAHPPTDDDYANTELDYGNETQGKLNEKNTILVSDNADVYLINKNFCR